MDFYLTKKRQTIFIFTMLLVVIFWSLPVAALTPNDPQLQQQSYLSRVQAFAGWDSVFSVASTDPVVVAVLDTGVDSDHPDLKEVMWVNAKEIPNNNIDDDDNSYVDDINGWNFVDSNNNTRPSIKEDFNTEAVNHGTVVAGIIGAGFNNGIGIAGLAPRAQIMALKALDNKGSGNTLVLAQAIRYAVDNGARVINLSLVGKVSDPELHQAIGYAYTHGVAIIAAAGNEDVLGINLDTTPRYPICEVAAGDQILGVASVDQDNGLSRFSNYGSSCIDVVAPGTQIYSTVPLLATSGNFSEAYRGGWAGTSVAAPMVTALVANIISIDPRLTLDRIYSLITKNTVNIASANPTRYLDIGAGLINFQTVLAEAKILSERHENLLVLGSQRGVTTVSITSLQGTLMSSFLPYSSQFTGGVNIATADLSGDSNLEIITAPRSAGGPHVRVFDQRGTVISQFMAFDPKFRGGLSLAVGDVDGDGVRDIVVAPESGGSPQVRVFDQQGNLKSQFMAYSPTFTGGVRLGVGDVDNDGIADIVTAPASSGGPHVRIFDHQGKLKSQFMAFKPTDRSGYSLAVANIDADRPAEIIVLDQNSAKGTIKTFSLNGQEKNTWLAFSALQQKSYQVAVIAQDVTGDGLADIVVYPAVAGESKVSIYDYTGQLVSHIVPAILNTSGWSLAILY